MNKIVDYNDIYVEQIDSEEKSIGEIGNILPLKII